MPPGDIDEGQPIDTVCNILRMTPHECVVTHAHGVLSDEINTLIGMQAIKLGYKWMHYAVTHGSPSSHRASFQKTEEGMDWYTVDLIDQASRIYHDPWATVDAEATVPDQ